MAARSLRAHLLRMLLPPIAALLVLGALVAYYPSIEPATEAYDQALIDVGISLGTYIRGGDDGYRLELPAAVDQVLRRDAYDTIYYRVISPSGEAIAGDEGLPVPGNEVDLRAGIASYDATYKGQKVRAVAMPAQCGAAQCRVLVAETTVKRNRLARDILFSTLLPEMLIAFATLVIVWFGVKRGLGPLARLSEEIKSRSPGDLRPVDAAGTPEEARALVSALNGLLEELAQASRNQQRFLANAAHQLRTPLAGLQAHTELALSQPLGEPVRGELQQVHQATIRTARLANQLLALARAEPGARGGGSEVNLKASISSRRGYTATPSFCARRSRTWCITASNIHSAAGASRCEPASVPDSHLSKWKMTARELRPPSASVCSSASTACRELPAPAAVWGLPSCARSPPAMARASSSARARGKRAVELR